MGEGGIELADKLDALGKACDAAGWVPVAERLPEPRSQVLVCYAYGGGRYLHTGWVTTADMWHKPNGSPIRGATHWQPLPELPRVPNEN